LRFPVSGRVSPSRGKRDIFSAIGISISCLNSITERESGDSLPIKSTLITQLSWWKKRCNFSKMWRINSTEKERVCLFFQKLRSQT
jgi:hypothetical protein